MEEKDLTTDFNEMATNFETRLTDFPRLLGTKKGQKTVKQYSSYIFFRRNSLYDVAKANGWNLENMLWPKAETNTSVMSEFIKSFKDVPASGGAVYSALICWYKYILVK